MGWRGPGQQGLRWLRAVRVGWAPRDWAAGFLSQGTNVQES